MAKKVANEYLGVHPQGTGGQVITDSTLPRATRLWWLSNAVAAAESLGLRLRTWCQPFVDPMPARLSPERLQAARLAAGLVEKKPDRPGLWLRTLQAGSQRIYRVTSQNGELYVISGDIFSRATPVERAPGYWIQLH